MANTHAVGIDLGTTYSCIAYLNEHGEPVTLANSEGELSTPSVVLFDGDTVVVGTEALRNAIANPEIVVQNSKRYMGDQKHCWTVCGKSYRPIDIAGFVLKKLLDDATAQIGSIEKAVITVPAQFSDNQRWATIKAGRQAGLKHVDIINEPVAAALCYVLGTEGMWFAELADEQRILVYDLGGGTFDLSLVRYQKNTVNVIASTGDLKLGGIDWNEVLESSVSQTFAKAYGADPRDDPRALQFLALEVENAKRALTVRQQAAVTCQHANQRKTFNVTQEKFEQLSAPLVDRTATITRQLLKDNKIGWAHVDVILTTGGSSRMPMIRKMLKRLGGRTLNTSLSPDQSIAHGATYYAGMLLTNEAQARSILSKDATERLAQIRQQSVNARALGILVRDPETGRRFPHELLPANSPLPVSVTQEFGTVVENQKRVRLRVIESGASENEDFVELGTCSIEELPSDLPIDSEIAVTLMYDEEARVHVSAKDVTSGKGASAVMVREENLAKLPDVDASVEDKSPDSAENADEEAKIHPQMDAKETSADRMPAPMPVVSPAPALIAEPISSSKKRTTPPPLQAKAIPLARQMAAELESAVQPVPLCNSCGEPLGDDGECRSCSRVQKPAKKRAGKAKRTQAGKRASESTSKKRKRSSQSTRPARPQPFTDGPDPDATPSTVPALPDDDDILDLTSDDLTALTGKRRVSKKKKSTKPKVKAPPLPPPLQPENGGQSGVKADVDYGEDEFWKLDTE
jgi:molecular chaperone DnaK